VRGHERVRIQSLKRLPSNYLLDSDINLPFFFFQAFANNSVINNIFEEDKSLIVEFFFGENSFALGLFGPKRRLQANHLSVRESVMFPQLGNQKRRK